MHAQQAEDTHARSAEAVAYVAMAGRRTNAADADGLAWHGKRATAYSDGRSAEVINVLAYVIIPYTERQHRTSAMLAALARANGYAGA
jgi:hypothetical protein